MGAVGAVSWWEGICVPLRGVKCKELSEARKGRGFERDASSVLLSFQWPSPRRAPCFSVERVCSSLWYILEGQGEWLRTQCPFLLLAPPRPPLPKGLHPRGPAALAKEDPLPRLQMQPDPHETWPLSQACVLCFPKQPAGLVRSRAARAQHRTWGQVTKSHFGREKKAPKPIRWICNSYDIFWTVFFSKVLLKYRHTSPQMNSFMVALEVRVPELLYFSTHGKVVSATC